MPSGFSCDIVQTHLYSKECSAEVPRVNWLFEAWQQIKAALRINQDEQIISLCVFRAEIQTVDHLTSVNWSDCDYHSDGNQRVC